MRRSRGFTLIEVLIASAIGLLVVGAAFALSVAATRDVDRDVSAFMIEEKLAEAMVYLQHDFRFTTLASIRAYPRESGEQVGVSLISAEPVGSFGTVQLSPYGSPSWQKQVFYTLVSSKAKDGSAQLIRYERALPGNIFQLVSDHQPYQYQPSPSDRIVSNSVLDQGFDLERQPDGTFSVATASTSLGGFTVSFLQNDGTTTFRNPTENDPALSTGLVEIELKLLEISDLGKTSMLPFRLRVAPRN